MNTSLKRRRRKKMGRWERSRITVRMSLWNLSDADPGRSHVAMLAFAKSLVEEVYLGQKAWFRGVISNWSV